MSEEIAQAWEAYLIRTTLLTDESVAFDFGHGSVVHFSGLQNAVATILYIELLSLLDYAIEGTDETR